MCQTDKCIPPLTPWADCVSKPRCQDLNQFHVTPLYRISLPMLHNFIATNRDELIERCKFKVAQRMSRSATPNQLRFGIPMFLDQLIKTLRVEQTTSLLDSSIVSGTHVGDQAHSEIRMSATQHGGELLKLGFSIDQVVHDYGDLCQAITDLAFEQDAPFQVIEFRTLNRCLDNAIADAVTEFARLRDLATAERNAAEMTEHLGFLAHELRNLLGSATLAFKAARAGALPLSGATGSVIERSLSGLGKLIDRSLAEVRIRAHEPVNSSLFSLADFIEEVKASAELEADVWGCQLIVQPVDPRIVVFANRDLMISAVGNLLQNAFKFTQPSTDISLVAHVIENETLIEVFDHCGGLPHGASASMFKPFTQYDDNKSGLGLGLSITRKNVELADGRLKVRDIPGIGCVFSIHLPRYALS